MERNDLFAGAACSLRDVLEARDRRAETQQALLMRLGLPLLSLTLNVPGPVKRFPLGDRFFAWALEQAVSRARSLGTLPEQVTRLSDAGGCTALLPVNASAQSLKQAMVQLEDSAPWTRLIDADVLDASGTKLDRAQLALPVRRCFLCTNSAHVCAASRAHGLPALEEYTKNMLTGWFIAEESAHIGREAQRALLYEVAVTPKPGLVDRRNNGAHKDMDFYAFLDSAAALYPYFADCAACGLTEGDAAPETLFRALRASGIRAEAAMRAATKGVNTHMGAIYSLGLLAAAVGVLTGRQESFSAEDVCRTAAVLAAFTPVPDGGAPNGARQEAISGFRSLVSLALPRMRALLAAGESPDRAGAETLLLLLTRVRDKNVLRRGGASSLAQLQRDAASLSTSPYDECAVTALDDALIRANISPGGSADLLAACFFLCFLTC